MRRVVAFLTVLLVIGIAVLIAGLIIKANPSSKQDGDDADTATAASPKAHKVVSMSLAPGFQILSADTQPGRLILHVRSPKRDEIDIIDLNDGQIISRIHSADENAETDSEPRIGQK